jgi:hypothetical protein
MDKFLKPERLDSSSQSPMASSEFTHWLRTFTNFIDSIPIAKDEDKLKTLTNYVPHQCLNMYKTKLLLVELLRN